MRCGGAGATKLPAPCPPACTLPVCTPITVLLPQLLRTPSRLLHPTPILEIHFGDLRFETLDSFSNITNLDTFFPQRGGRHFIANSRPPYHSSAALAFPTHPNPRNPFRRPSI